ncbi:hypothetical protein Tco_0419901, partial [Tanacetum coccineum]
MVKNLDNVGKFFMYPRFVQVFLDKQLEGTGYSLKDKNKAKTDKTEHRMEKRGKA